MIQFYVIGQTLKVAQPVIAADTIDYLEADFHFQTADWNGADVWAHFYQKETHLKIALEDGHIGKDKHLNLTAGSWDVYLEGDKIDGEKITTVVVKLIVQPTGALTGDGSLPDKPPNEFQQLIQQAKKSAEASAASAVKSGQSATIAEQNANSAVEFAEQANNAKLGAQMAKDGAVAAQELAEGAQSSALNSMQSATLSAQKAETASAAALNSLKNAEGQALTAKTEADRAKSEADKLMNADVPAAVNEALANAKESGEFNGAQGPQGIPGPEGKKGETGATGPAGKDGFSPTVKVTETADGAIITATDKSGTTSATLKNGKDGGAQIDDNTVNKQNAWSSKHIIDTLAPPFTQKAPIVQAAFIENYPLSIKSYIEPIQEGSGEPSPDNVRPIRGVTALNMTVCGDNIADIPEFQLQVPDRRTKTIPQYIPAGAYKIRVSFKDATPDKRFGGGIKFIYAISGETDLRFTQFSENWEASVTLEKAAKIMYFYLSPNEDPSKIVTFSSVMLSLQSTPYAPYSGTPYTQTLPEEIFGGEFNWETGKLSIGYKTATFTGNEAWQASPVKDGTFRMLLNIFAENVKAPTTTAEIVSGTMCDTYKVTSSSGTYNSVDGISQEAKKPYIYVYDRRYNTQDVEAWKNYLKQHPITYVYALENPEIVQLPPTPGILSRDGVTSAYCNSGDTEVSGRLDPNAVIRELRNAILALGGNV